MRFGFPQGRSEFSDEFAAHAVQLGDGKDDGIRKIYGEVAEQKRRSAELAELHAKGELTKRSIARSFKWHTRKNAVPLAVDEKWFARPASCRDVDGLESVGAGF